jgi:hypothetical protein
MSKLYLKTVKEWMGLQEAEPAQGWSLVRLKDGYLEYMILNSANIFLQQGLAI